MTKSFDPSYPDALSICIEDIEATSDATRYLMCVALPGDVEGLTLSDEGEVQWKHQRRVAAELWVSADQRLMLLRPEDAVPVLLIRAGRKLQAPAEQPVPLLTDDEVHVGLRRLRVHLHGETHWVTAPDWYTEPSSPSVARAAVAALAVGATIAGIGCTKELKPDTERPRPAVTAPMQAGADAGTKATKPDAAVKPPPMIPRIRPPKPVYRGPGKSPYK